MVDDETLFRTMEVAAQTGALVMVHAENGDAIDVLVKQALADGKTEPKYHALTRPARDRGRGDEPRDPARARGRRAALRRPRLVHARRSSRSSSPATRAGTSGARPAPSTSSSTTTFLEKPDFEGAKYVYTPPAADEGEPGAPLERGPHRQALGDLDRPLRLPLGRPEDARQGRLLEDPERRPGAREPAPHDPRVRRARRADLAQPDGRAAGHEPREAVRALPAQGHDRGRLGRRHRRLRPREEADDHGGEASTRRRTTTSTRAPR